MEINDRRIIGYITSSGGLIVEKNGEILKFCPYSFAILRCRYAASFEELGVNPHRPNLFTPVYEGEQLILDLTYRGGWG